MYAMTESLTSGYTAARISPQRTLFRKRKTWLSGAAVGLLAAFLLVFVFGSPVKAASATDFADGYFEILSATEKTAHFSILPAGQCTRLDIHCSVQVTIRNGTIPNLDKKSPTAAWTDQLEACQCPGRGR